MQQKSSAFSLIFDFSMKGKILHQLRHIGPTQFYVRGCSLENIKIILNRKNKINDIEDLSFIANYSTKQFMSHENLFSLFLFPKFMFELCVTLTFDL